MKTNEKLKNIDLTKLTTPVSPQLLKIILEYGSYTEDNLIQDYLAGLLFSARTGIENDNRSSVYGLLIQNMSVYEIRLHYLIYTIIRKVFKGNKINLGIIKNRFELQVFISFNYIYDNIVSSEEERSDAIITSIFESSIYGLIRHDLIEDDFVYGSPEHIANECKGSKLQDSGIIVQPSILGIELFLWISGISSKTHSVYYLDENIDIPELIQINEYKNGYFKYP